MRGGIHEDASRGGASAQRPAERADPRPPALHHGARERILAAAVRRIAREGIDGVRIARIAMDAGVSPALVHYHFATREALLAEALDYSYSLAADARVAGDLPPDASHAERLAAMIDQCLPTTPALEEDWVLWVELWLRAVRHPELRPFAEELYARMRAWFAQEIAAGVADGEFARCDPDDVADRTLALLDGFGVRALIGDPAVPLERARRAVSASLAADLGIGDRLVRAGRALGPAGRCPAA
ncbi:MAG TPA: TetR/AcrR family transcriptional regulator [Solirubrobacteraceae bacterium]|nr:TetR/AcrR family transcriptional regulator [Solirubrobacteraceae bacterium]